MTDRELLEAAARAAGRTWLSYHHTKGLCCRDESYGGLIEYYWNPLTNDGDALRLAVKLGMLISHSAYKPEENAYGFIGIAWYGQKVEFESEKFTNDPYAATRRAIVRAAAALGGLK